MQKFMPIGLVIGSVLFASIATGNAQTTPAHAAADHAAQAPKPRLIDGVVVSAYDVELAFPTAGVVQSVAVKPGAAVKTGQTLAAFDNEAQKAQLTLAQMQWEQSRNALAKAQQHAKTVAAYVKAGRKIQADAQAAQSALHDQELLTAKDQFAYLLAKRRYEQRTLKAPVAGAVARILVAKGQYVAAGQPVLRLVQPEHLYVQANVPTQVAATLQVGDGVRITPRSAGDDHSKPVAGKIAYLSQVVDAPTDTRRARIELTADAPPNFLIGSYVTVELSPTQ